MKIHTLSVFITLALLAGCNENETLVIDESRPVKLHTFAKQESTNTREFPATVEAGQKTFISFRVSGQLDQVSIHSGDHVSAGDVLATLISDEHVLFLEKAQATHDLARVQYLRMEKLKKDNIVSEQDYERALANYLSAKSSLQQAELNLNYTTLLAPYDGQVSNVYIENHQYVAKDQTVINLQSTNEMKAEFYLPATVLQTLTTKKMTTPSLVLDAFPDQSFSLNSLEVNSEGALSTNTYKVTMRFTSPEVFNITPGMAGNVSLSMSGKINPLPKSSYFQEKQNTFAWRISPSNTAEKVQITIDDNGHVLSGLDQADVIIASGVNHITEGMKVHEWVKERGL